MPKIDIEWDNGYNTIYESLGHPLGKNRRGRKKWLKRFLVHALKRIAQKLKDESN